MMRFGAISPAFTELYRVNRPRVLAQVSRAVRDRDDVEDLVQMTFVKAFRALPRFPSGCGLFYLADPDSDKCERIASQAAQDARKPSRAAGDGTGPGSAAGRP